MTETSTSSDQPRRTAFAIALHTVIREQIDEASSPGECWEALCLAIEEYHGEMARYRTALHIGQGYIYHGGGSEIEAFVALVGAAYLKLIGQLEAGS